MKSEDNQEGFAFGRAKIINKDPPKLNKLPIFKYSR